MENLPEKPKKPSVRRIAVWGTAILLCAVLICFLLIQGPGVRYPVPKLEFTDHAQATLLMMRVLQAYSDQQKQSAEQIRFDLTGADLSLLLKYGMIAAEDESFCITWEKDCFHLKYGKKLFPGTVNLDFRFTGVFQNDRLRLIPLSAKAGLLPLPAFLCGSLCEDVLMQRLLAQERVRAVLAMVESVTPADDGFRIVLRGKQLSNLPFILMNRGNSL